MGKRKKSKYQLFRHQLVTVIIMFGLFCLSAGWYLIAPSVTTCLLMLFSAVMVPLFPSDTRPEMTDLISELALCCLYAVYWLPTAEKFLLPNLIATGCAAVVGALLVLYRFELQSWLNKHPADQFVYKRSNCLIYYWLSFTVLFGGTVGVISGEVDTFFCASLLIIAAGGILLAAARTTYRLVFQEDALLETTCFHQKHIPFTEISHCKIGGLFSKKIMGKNGKSLIKIRLSMVGPEAKLIRLFGKRTKNSFGGSL